MSEKTGKTDQAYELLKKYQTIEEMKKHIEEIAEKIGSSRSTVYRAIDRFPPEHLEEMVLPAEEPTIKIEAEKEIPEEELVEEEEEEIPEELEEIEPEIVPEPEIPPEIAPPEAPEEIEELRPIFIRSLRRLTQIWTTNKLLQDKISLSKQEAEDSEVVLTFLIAKYAGIGIEKWYLEITGLTHFGTLLLRGLIVHRALRKGKEEKAKQEATKPPEPEEKKAEEEITEETPPKPLEKGKSIPKYMKGMM